MSHRSMWLQNINLFKAQQQYVSQWKFLATYHRNSLTHKHTQTIFHFSNRLHYDKDCSNSPETHLCRVIIFAYFVQESKHAARTAPLFCSTLVFLYSYNFLVFPFREKLATFLSAAHKTEVVDLPKQPTGFNYLINLREDLCPMWQLLSLYQKI